MHFDTDGMAVSRQMVLKAAWLNGMVGCMSGQTQDDDEETRRK